MECGQLRLRFYWHQDRFAHAVWRVDWPTEAQFLTSVEGSASEDWPASPPWQSLHLDEQDQRHVALLVGMAGKCHWSAAVEFFPDQSRIRWDVACRVRAARQVRLGSRYRTAASMQIRDSHQALLGDEAAGLVVRLDGEPRHARLLQVADGLEIVVEPSNTSDAAATVRWCYVIESAGK